MYCIRCEHPIVSFNGNGNNLCSQCETKRWQVVLVTKPVFRPLLSYRSIQYTITILLAIVIGLTILSIIGCAAKDKYLILKTSRDVIDTVENIVLDAYKADKITWVQVLKFDRINKKVIASYNTAVKTQEHIDMKKYYHAVQDLALLLEEFNIEIPKGLKYLLKE